MEKVSTWENQGRRRSKGLICFAVTLSMALIFMMSFSAGVYAKDKKEVGKTVLPADQLKTVQGKVVDEKGEEMVGVTILVKGTTLGVVTDLDGKFSLDVPVGGTLVISYVGYKTQEIVITNQSSLNVKMVPDSESLEEVVVIGYGSVKKKDLTGAVTSFKSNDITVTPTANAMEALQGKIAGMDIIKPTGQVGEDVEILLRGSRSIYGDNDPLFIIDGIPGSYNQINPSDIESMDVLKDASSTAIYGSAGANGVVIITTKRGKEGKATVNFDAYFGISGKPEFWHGMMGEEWTNYQKEAYKYSFGQYPSDMSAILTDAEQYAAYQNGKWIDWVNEAIDRTAKTQKYSLSVTGGTEKTKVFTSLNYQKDEGLLSKENFTRYGLRLNLDQEIFPWAKMGVTSNLTYSIKNGRVKNTFTKSLSALPLGEVYDEFGDLKYEYVNNNYTPLGDQIANQFVDETRNTYANANAYLELTPVKGLSFKTVISATLTNSRRGQYWGAQTTALIPSYAGTPHASITNSYSYGYTWENILTYNTTIAENHSLTATVVSSWSKEQKDNNLNSSSGQELDSWSFYRLLAGSSKYNTSDYAQTQKMSFAGRLNYSYKGKYLLTVSSRWDGVSWLSEGNKWDVFPAAAIGWRLSEEGFLANTKEWLSNLKLRVGYGITGNSGGVGAYGTSSQAYSYSSGAASVDGSIAQVVQFTGTYVNPDLGWEKSYNWNYGLDMAFLNSRIDATVDFYTTKTKDLLFKRQLPITSGITGWGSPLAMWQNIAETSNKGVEFTINTRTIQTKEFQWNTTLSFTWSKEKIESLPDGDLIKESLFEGQPVKSFYDYKYAGIWGTQTDAETLEAYGVKPGWVKIETIDQEGDGGVHKYGEKDKQVLGHKNPDYIIGFNNTFSYKNFDLSVFAMGRYGQTISSSLIGWYTAKTDANQPSGTDYWTENNQGAYYPVPGSGGEQSVISALKYRDGSFVKIKNITLGYTLPQHITRHARIEKARFYVTAYNPFIFVKDKQLKDTDPETNGADSFPLYKQFVFGVNLTF